MDGLDDIVEEFLVESHENLDQLDSDLVALEQDPNSRERLSSIFRTIHTIKGTSGFLAFNRLEEVTHVGENMLSRLRDGELALTPARTSVLLQMVDTVRSLLTSIEASGGEGSVDVSAVVAAITAAMDDSWYGLAKSTSEWIVRAKLSSRFPICILRIPGIFGASMKDRSVIGQFVASIRRQGKGLAIAMNTNLALTPNACDELANDTPILHGGAKDSRYP